jgi:aconitate hydratase
VTHLLGVRAVIARSFERIHRSNLVGMGVLPLMFQDEDSYERLGLDGSETFSVTGIRDIKPRKRLHVHVKKNDGTQVSFEVLTRLDTDVEVSYFFNGGILPFVLRKLLDE